MRPSLLVAAAVLLSAGIAAKADTFNFSFGTSTDTIAGSGILTANSFASATDPNLYLITGVTGTTRVTLNGGGSPITEILDPGTFPTLANGGNIPANDNLLDVVNGIGTLDLNGLSYILRNGAQVNLFNGGTNPLDVIALRVNASVPISESTPITITAVTPEPSSFVLLGTGLLGAFGAMRRRLS